MTRKKILLVANVAKEHVLKFHIPTICALAKDGWVVDVACSADAEIPQCHKCWDMKYKRNPISIHTFEGVLQLRKILANEGYDVVYCHTPTGGMVARLAVAGLGRKPAVIYLAHGFHFFDGAPRKNWLVYFPMEKFLAKWTDYLITINQEDFSFAQKEKMYKKGIYQIPGIGVDVSKLASADAGDCRQRIRSELGVLQSDFVLIYVAELIKNKNQGKLIDVVEKLQQKGKDVKLVLVGPDHNNGAFQNYAVQKRLGDKVIFTGWRNDVRELLHAADLCVASSVREGFGLNLVEAMACGLPVVAFNNRGHREIVINGQNGFLVQQGAVDDMVSCIETIMASTDNFYSSNAKESAKYFDVHGVTGKLVSIINLAYEQKCGTQSTAK